MDQNLNEIKIVSGKVVSCGNETTTATTTSTPPPTSTTGHVGCANNNVIKVKRRGFMEALRKLTPPKRVASR
jgi:hypothetical protein